MERVIRVVTSPLPDRAALVGVIAAGLGWSLSVGWAKWGDVQGSGLGISQALPPLVAGGAATVLSLWFAIGAVLWAMCRACGQRAAFRSVLTILSGSGLALCLAAPAVAFHLAGGTPWPLWGLFAVGSALFCTQVAGRLHQISPMPPAKAWACLAMTGIFCTSFVSLYQ